MNKYINYIDEKVDLQIIYGKQYSIGRLLLSLSTFITIALNNEQRLFNISFLPNPNINSIYLSKFSIFNLFYPDNLLLAKVISCILLLLIMAGFFPRIACLIQWWLSFSIHASAYITEGGDQINMILSFLIIPICIFDGRINQWTSRITTNNIKAKITIFTSIIIIKLQIAVLYFTAGISKIYAEQWREGTALYYWVGNSNIGFNKIIEPIVLFLFDNRYILFFSTWSVIIFEIVLSLVLLTKANKKFFLMLAMVFHSLIFVSFGLFSFGLSMAGGLLFYFSYLNKKTENV